MALKLPADFNDFLSLLNAHRVEYLLVGGYAVTIHGYVRASKYQTSTQTSSSSRGS